MEKFEITKEQVIQLAKNNQKNKEQLVDADLRNWFPDAFKTKFTGWAKDIDKMNKDWIAYYKNDILRYGINANGDWFKSKSNANYNECESNREATEEEVKTALINEAKKRGLIDGGYIKSTNGERGLVNDGKWIYCKIVNSLYYAGFILFDNGKWATIIETITKEEAEKLLNKKII